MSLQTIYKYYKEVEDLEKYGGKTNEAVISNKFADLINAYGEKRNLKLIPQLPLKTAKGTTVRPDGTLKNILRLDYGFWESKANVDLYDEINKKIKVGYPLSNTLFEDSKIAILYQRGEEVAKAKIADAEKLNDILTKFTSYERPEVRQFNEALEQFKTDLPHVLDGLRDKINEQEKTNPKFVTARNKFLEMCKESINPEITIADANEMLLQHILTEEIFVSIFSDAQFHRENNIAKELYKVEETFFTGKAKKDTLDSISSYYEVIKANASGFADHHEKQRFLKVIYENFYKAYNPKSADRLGIVYTPNEIVKFQIESVDYLLQKHFSKGLHEKNVEILDPCTGTGTYITDIIEYIPKQFLKHKFQNEIHANEIALLPYYIANLNIEYTYQSRMNEYEEFKNICWVDTLDNMAFGFDNKQTAMFGVTAENSERIKRQNARKISVIIGNPPYNANQQNENDNNKNRDYYFNRIKKIGGVDGRIKDTYIKYSTAQKTKVYDMYSRFYRWASDRIDKNGVVCFITNNSFINARTYDGFRKCIQQEFDECYILDLGGNIYELSGKDGIFLNEEHTIFGQAAAVGIAIMFLVRNSFSKEKNCNILYIHPTDIRAKREEKIEYLKANAFENIPFEKITPDKNNNWINLTDNDFEDLLPLGDRNVKSGKGTNAVFEIYSTGINSGRDEWVTDFSKNKLLDKIAFYNTEYNKYTPNTTVFDNTIKWSRNIKDKIQRGMKETFKKQKVVPIAYRPFINKWLYNSQIFLDERGNSNELFGRELVNANLGIAITGPNSQKPFLAQGVYNVNDYHFVGSASSTQFFALYKYDETGNKVENITDWGLQQFRDHYRIASINLKTGKRHYKGELITKEDIFNYTYAVLHNPAYRKKYELNLKREFPRLPYYKDFFKWVDWGKTLMDLHIGYENVKPFKITRTDKAEDKPRETKQQAIFNKHEEPEVLFSAKGKLKVKLKAVKEEGVIEIDEQTTLKGFPKEAWQYKLGNRSALEWVLDQYKEYKPSDPTIAEKFNNYRFADYKEEVIELLKKVCTVSVETMKVIAEMERENV